MSALQSLLSGEGFMPHGMCYLWKPELLWLHVISDSVVALSYFAIPPTLLWLVLRARRELAGEAGRPLGLRGIPYESMFLAFGVFIVACGVTHLIAVYTVWTPAYWLSGSAKAITAVASLATAVALPPLVPKALELIRGARDAERNRLSLEEAHRELRAVHLRLRETDRLRTELFANVSHELRTPLTLILGPAERMLRRDDLGADDRRGLEVLRRNALQLLGHVDDLLEAASLESGTEEIRFAEADLAATARSVAGNFTLLAEDRAIDLEVDAPDTLPAAVDRPKIERIVLNLLSNAFKFTPDGGRIRLRVQASETEDGWADIRVDDGGPGVPEHLRTLIFERFRQGDGTETRQVGGTGLGLAIAREFATAHGGSLEVADSDLGGARFVLRLPLRPGLGVAVGATPGEHVDAGPTVATLESARREAPRPTAGPADGAPRVLVVEDNAEMRRYLVDVLRPEYACIEATDGQSGLETALREVPDLVVTDLMMPGMSGWQLIRELREAEELADVPVLVLTARADPHLPATLLGEGAQDYLVKPVRADELAARVKNLISAATARRVLRSAVSSAETDLGVLSREVTRRTRDLEETVQQREVLLRELHHRVKGNLQTLTSLLRLQRRAVGDEAARDALLDVEARVGAIALVHEKLYAGGDPSSVEMAGYLRSLADRTVELHGGLAAGVRMDFDLARVVLPVDTAIPCGLIAFELLHNALAHGVGEGAEVLALRLTIHESELRLTVEDDGPGLDGARSGGFGLELVDLLAQQLRGRLERVDADGVRWTLTFPHASQPERATR